MSNEWVMLDGTVDIDLDQVYETMDPKGMHGVMKGMQLAGSKGWGYSVRVPRAKANDAQISGDHYKSKAIQPWDYITSNNMGYLEGNVVKYVSRWKEKNGVEDLKKAQHYLQKLIEVTGNE